MAPKPTSNSKLRFLYSNWLSLLGVYLFILSLIIAAILFVLEFAAFHQNIYVSAITLIAAPLLIISSLGIIIVGVLFERYRQRKRVGPGTEERITPPRLIKYLIPSSSILAVVFLVMTVYGAYRSYEFAGSNRFCGMMCHQVMTPEYMAHQFAPHARVDCVKCHIGPGAAHMVKSKVRGIYQIYSMIEKSYPRPLATPLKNMRPAREVCEQCHWPEKFHGKVMKEYAYFLPDEFNTRIETKLLLNVGGSGVAEEAAETGVNSGAHWHMNINNQIYYIAVDERHQQIPWIKFVDNQGKETVYMDSDIEMTEKELLEKFEIHQMDCIDCHNRAVHRFNPPQRALNAALLSGRIAPSMPFIKQKALQVLRQPYEDKEQAMENIRSTLSDYYEKEHRQLWDAQNKRIKSNIAAVVDIYQKNFFPTMKADWRAYPDNRGHLYSDGCFRCHTPRHVSAGGRNISHGCTGCHKFFAADRESESGTFNGGADYRHPEDIAEMWRESLCTDCHTGAGTDY
jgi:nitrate/TMAO reductase-like tetraheme cytochrome c subunit